MITGRQRSFGVRRASLLWAIAFACALPAGALAEQRVAAIPPALDAPADVARPAENLHTKFVVGLERPVEFQVFTLTHPNRVFVELPDVRLQLPALPGDGPVGLIKSFRGGRSAPGKARIVIDVTGPVVVANAAIEKATDGNSPHLVLDIAPVGAVAPKAERRTVGLLQPPLPRPAVSPHQRALSAYRPVIVLDPGHGGEDSGATKFGTVEKNVVLSFALKLRSKLEETGRYKVLMTRDKDVFVPLEERRAFAERHMAALFIAIHADYAQSKARGATIYSLRESVANELQRAAKGRVSKTVLSNAELAAVKKIDGDVSVVQDILADLASREVEMTKERTGVLARSVIEFMGETTNLKEDPDRSAAFVVLKTAQVPAILIELGYVTNVSDSELLKSDKWRDKVSASIVTAIENYFSHRMARLPM
ncbi:MAG TPA: N-acetylmuramoyl-L-alanine amidase [Hyphomicrobiaceae bacterium]|nr:N-acetylmuramoyl-L-alanine amidase [Hyphomicrobiaceae bacterium]